MGKYLQMDGVDDNLKTPSLTFDKVVFDVEIDINHNTNKRSVIQHNNGNIEIHFGYQYRNYVYNTKINGTSIAYGADISIYDDKRIQIEATLATITAQPNIFSNGNFEHLKGKIYTIKFFNAGALVAHYDMSTGTVLDQSGNGNHATLTGGTWAEQPNYFLQMDGVDDLLRGGTVTADRIAIEYEFDGTHNESYSYIFDTRTTGSNWLYISSSNSYGGAYGTGILNLELNKRILVDAQVNTFTGAPYFFYKSTGNYTAKAKVYYIKLYNAGALVAHYDMSTGTVLDQSGNGNHATLTGGTWSVEGSTEPPADSGTDGSITGDLKQIIYLDAAANADVKQVLYSDAVFKADVKQVLYSDVLAIFDMLNTIYQDGSASHDSKQLFYTDQAAAFDVKNMLYQDAASAADTKQILYEISAKSFDMLQEFFSDGQTGSTPFDLFMRIYADGVMLFDSKQQMYKSEQQLFDLYQRLYEAGSSKADFALTIYQDAKVNHDARFTLYADNQIIFDSLQSMYETGKRNFDLKQFLFEAESTQQNFDLHLVIYEDQFKNVDLLQALFADAQQNFDTSQVMFDPDKQKIGVIHLKGERKLYVYLMAKQDLTIKLKGGVNMTMKNQNFNMHGGDTKYIVFPVEGVTDLTGAAFVWELRKKEYLPNVLTKTSGITITGSGEVQLKLDPADTEGLSGIYYHECKMTDNLNNVSTVFEGLIEFE